MLRTVTLTLACSTALLVGCGPREPLAQRLEHDLLQRQREALLRELARPPLVADSDVTVVVPAPLIDEMLLAALPIEGIVDDRFRITADSGRVDFEGGLALLRLHGRVAAVDRETVSAAIELAGALQVLEIGESGTLSSRVEILGWRVDDVGLGMVSAPAARLLEELASRPIADLNELLSRIELPVRLLPSIHLPTVAEPEVTIPAVEVPLSASVRDVRVGGGSLWVTIDLGLGDAR